MSFALPISAAETQLVVRASTRLLLLDGNSPVDLDSSPPEAVRTDKPNTGRPIRGLDKPWISLEEQGALRRSPDQAERNKVPSERMAADGSVHFAFFRSSYGTHAGAYELRWLGMKLAEFRVNDTGQELVVEGLPDSIPLPFNMMLRTTPGLDVPVYDSGGAPLQRMKANEAGVVPIKELYPPWVFVIAAPETAPQLAMFARPAPDNKSLSPRCCWALPSKFSPKSGFPVHNLVSDTFYWLNCFKRPDKEAFCGWLLSYSMKTQSGAANYIPIADWDATVKFHTGPSLVLDEAGVPQLYLEYGGREEKDRIRRTYRLDPDFTWASVETTWPYFVFRGRHIQGSKWVHPFLQALPLELGNNTISGDAVGEYTVQRSGMPPETKQERFSGSDSFALEMDRYGHLSAKPDVFCSPPDLPMSLDAEKRGLEIPSLQAAVTNWHGKKSTEIAANVRSLTARANGASASIPNGTIVGISVPRLISGKASVNGAVQLDYAAVLRVGTPTIDEDANGNRVVRTSGEREVETHGLFDVVESISLIDDAHAGFNELINTREGPYPELRYRRWVGTGKDRREEILRIQPENYNWQVAANNRIVPDYSQMYDPSAEVEVARMDLEATAPGFLGDKRTKSQPGTKPSLFRAWGTVKDDAGAPVAGATVRLANPAQAAMTDAEGRYDLRQQAAGDRPWEVPVDFVLKRVVTNFVCTLETKGPFIANGREVELVCRVTSGGKPLARRALIVAIPEEWTKGGMKAKYVKYPGPFDNRPTTDENGVARVKWLPPVVIKEVLGTLRGLPRNLASPFFPLNGVIEVQDAANPALKGTMAYQVQSPYPDIKQFRLEETDAGTWQKRGSTLEIADADSDRFSVSIRVYGHVKVAGGPITRNGLSQDVKGKSLTFYYRPFEMGDDLNEQPGALWKEFGALWVQIAGEYCIDMGGGLFLALAPDYLHWKVGRDPKMTHFGFETVSDKVVHHFVEAPPTSWKQSTQDFFTTQVFEKSKSGLLREIGGLSREQLYDSGKFGLAKMAADDQLTQLNEDLANQQDRSSLDADSLITFADAKIGLVDSAPFDLASSEPLGKPIGKLTESVRRELFDNMKPSPARDRLEKFWNKAGSEVKGEWQPFKSVANVKYNIPLEALKFVYANAKLLRELHNQFSAIADAFQDTTLLPVIIEITDEDGHRIEAMRCVAVRSWEKAP